MMEVTGYAVIPAPPDRVWELVSDSSRYHEWVEGTDAVTRTDGPTKPGSTYDEVNPILGPWKAKTHWTVTEYVAPRRQVHALHLCQDDPRVALVAQLAADRHRDLRGRQAGHGHLIEQGLEQVVIAAVDQRDVDVSAAQRLGHRQARKSAAHDHDVPTQLHGWGL